MAISEILPFATGISADVQSQADYAAALSTTNGFTVGIAEPAFLNKVWRQSSFVASGIAGYLVAKGIDVPDDGDLATFIDNLSLGIDGFMQEGTGATQRTKQGKSRDIISVMDFIPIEEQSAIRAQTSTYDCTAAFASAFASLPPVTGDPFYEIQGGGTVWVEQGYYNASKVALTSRQNLFGDGYASIIHQISSSSGALVTMGTPGQNTTGDGNSIRMRIKDVALKGPPSVGIVDGYQVLVPGNYGIAGYGVMRSYIDDIQIQGFLDDGIHIAGGSYGYIRGCTIVGNINRGIYLVSDGALKWLTDYHVEDCDLNINYGPGVEVSGNCVGTRIYDNTLESNGLQPRYFGAAGHQTPDKYVANMFLSNTTYIYVDNNYFEGTSAYTEEKVDIMVNGYSNWVTKNVFNNNTSIILWSDTVGGTATQNIFAYNTFPSTNPNFKNLYSLGSVRGTDNRMSNNIGLDIYEQVGLISQVFDIMGHCDKLVHDIQSATAGASYTPNVNVITGGVINTNGSPKGNEIFLTLDQNTTINLPQYMASGEEITFYFTQDATGGRTVSFNGQYHHAWSNTGNAANKTSSITFILNNSTLYQKGAQSPYYS